MAQPYSIDLRERVVAAVAAGATVREAASRFGVAVSTAVKWSQRQRRTGSVAPGKMGGHRRPVVRDKARTYIVMRIAQKPDLTVRALQSELLAASKRAAIRFGFVSGLNASAVKKTVFAQEQMRPRTARFRLRWKAHQSKIDPSRLVFVDETWIKTNMTRTRGWSPRGTPLHAKVPHGNWQTLTFLAGLRLDRIDAPWVLDGPINRDSFETWVETQLIPLLKPGDIVVLDNLSSHKSQKARKAIKAKGAHLFFLPPYSPDLNPIEQAFAKLKTLIRKQEARTADELWKAAGRVLDTFTPVECSNYLRNAGYASI